MSLFKGDNKLSKEDNKLISEYSSLNFNEWRISSFIGKGEYGLVFNLTNEDFVIKLPRKVKGGKKVNKMIQDLLYSEYMNLINLNPSPYTVNVSNRQYGIINEIPFLVMKKLQRTLRDLNSSDRNVNRIFIDCISGLEDIHNRNYLIVDMKPENIMLDNRDKVYYIDLSCSRLINSVDSSQEGTPSYFSLNVHENKVRNKRDELESLLYVFLSILYELPWKDAKSLDEIYQMKRDLCLQDYGIVGQAIKFVRESSSVNYRYVKSLF